MNIHKYARLTPHGREILVRRIVEEGLPVGEAAQASGVSERTAYKWLAFRDYQRLGVRIVRNHVFGPFWADLMGPPGSHHCNGFGGYGGPESLAARWSVPPNWVRERSPGTVRPRHQDSERSQPMDGWVQMDGPPAVHPGSRAPSAAVGDAAETRRGTETHHPAPGHGHRLVGPGIPGHARLAGGGLEHAEPPQHHPVAALQRGADAFKQHGHRVADHPPLQVDRFLHPVDEVGLHHAEPMIGEPLSKDDPSDPPGGLGLGKDAP